MHETSLSDRLSKRISVSVLVLMALLTIGLQAFVYVTSKRLYERQVDIWISSLPQSLLPHLVDSDHFSITGKIRLIESTGLFESVVITDSDKREIVRFDKQQSAPVENEIYDLKPVQDTAGTVWGYYVYKADFRQFFEPFIQLGIGSLFLMFALYLMIRWWLTKSLDGDLRNFNTFLSEIEKLAEKIASGGDDSVEFTLSANAASEEQQKINRAILGLVTEITRSQQRIKEFIASSEKRKTKDEIARVALQVAHDIRSPLAALRMLQKENSGMPEAQRRLLIMAIDRVDEIASNLLNVHASGRLSSQARADGSESSVRPLAPAIQRVVAEQRMARRESSGLVLNFELSRLNFAITARFNESELKRTLSNLINNAVEAVPNNRAPEIDIELRQVSAMAVISISDNGRGMSNEKLAKLNRHEFGASDKTSGHGLGLQQAWSTVTAAGGNLRFERNPIGGTCVLIEFPLMPAPTWLKTSLCLRHNTDIFILDDDPSIHQIWGMRLKEFRKKHFSTYAEFVKALEDDDRATSERIYLIDHELVGEPMTGVEIIEKHGIATNAILVSATQYDQRFISRLESSKISFLPKEFANVVAIH